MSDNDLHYDSDEYHEDDYHDLHRDDSLPDLVLSSSTIRDSDPDLLEPPADLESEYFSTSEQVNTSVCSRNGNIRVSYTDHDKPYMTHRISSCSDKYRSYLNLTIQNSASDEEEETLQDEFNSPRESSPPSHASAYFSLSPENQTKQRRQWIEELEEAYREMDMLEETIRNKVRYAQSLKRNLGVTAWREFSDDMKVGMRKFQESPMYLKVEAELANLAVKLEEEASTWRSRASSEVRKASIRTSEHLTTASKKLSHQLQKIGVMEPSKEYRKDDVDPVLTPPTISSEIVKDS